MAARSSRLSLRDYLDFAVSDLGQRKLRTFLTSFGVTVGIGALVAMVGFGKGMQRNVTDNFAKLDLFNSLTVLPAGGGLGDFGPRRGRRAGTAPTARAKSAVLDDAAVAELGRLAGVESVFPEVRFPAMIRLGEAEEFRLVQVVPARIAGSRLLPLRAGRPFASDDEEAILVGAGLLRALGLADPDAAVGRTAEIISLSFDLASFDPAKLGAILGGGASPFKRTSVSFRIAGVMETGGFGGGVTPLASDVLLPPGPAGRLPKLSVTNIWDLFRMGPGGAGYSAVNVRLKDPSAAAAVKRAAADKGFTTFSLLDQFQQIKTSFVLMDMMLAAIGMIAIFVAALGIVNTMVMAVLERTNEIGIMKAVGASPAAVQKIFVFESSLIGLAGGLFGLVLGWAVSRIINPVINYFAAKEGLPAMEYFSFPAWLCLGAVAFAVLISLAAGIYPARRAARVDPAVALRHE
jgi:putative ABC transport system permease protein